MNKHADFKPITSKIYAMFNRIIKEARSKEDLDGLFDELMEWIDDNYFLTYYGSEFKEDNEDG